MNLLNIRLQDSSIFLSLICG